MTWALSALWVWLGAGTLIAIGCGVAAFFIPNWRREFIEAAIVAAVATWLYGKGAADEHTRMKAVITKQIDKANAKGDAGRAKALKDFDAASDLPDDGFSRP